MNFKKALSCLLVASISLSSVSTAFADGEDIKFESTKYIQNNNNVILYDDGISINGKFYTQKEFEKLLDTAIPISVESDTTTYVAGALLIPGTWFIPGVGQVVITAAGAVIVAGATIAVGSWIYNKVISFFKEHTKNKRKSTHDKHTKPRSGRDTEKKKQKPDWKPRNPRKRRP